MKKLYAKYAGVIAALALMVTATAANRVCMVVIHQPEMPAGAEKAKKVLKEKMNVPARITDSLVNAGAVPMEDKELYEFGIRQGILLVINIVTALLIGLFMGMFWQCIVFLIAYNPIRSYAGGYHAGTPMKCYLLSIPTVFVVLLGVKMIPWNGYIIIIGLICTGIIISLLAPVEDKNKPLDQLETKVYRKRVLIVLAVLTALTVVLWFVGMEQIAPAIIMSLVLITVMLIIGALKNKMLMEKVNGMYKLRNGFGDLSETIETIIYKHAIINLEETHASRVSSLCKSMGVAMCLPDDEIRRLEVGGFFHDIGKMAIKEQLLSKEEPLTVNEWDEIMSHAEVGYMILHSSPEMSDVADFIRHHHERYDGSGYPEGLKEEEIPLLSRIITIADSYDAMINERSYKTRMDPDRALYELIINKGKQFDPGIVDIFIEKVLSCTI